MIKQISILLLFVISVQAEDRLQKAEQSAVSAVEREGYLSLDDCIDLALEQNFRILEAEEVIREQLGSELRAKSVLYPKLRVFGDYEKVDESRLPTFGEGSFGSDEGWSGDIEVEQPLFLGGAGLADRREQRFRTEAARFALLSVINQVLFEVRSQFYDVLLAKSQVTVREEAVKLLEEELRAEKNRLEAGTVSEFNVLRAEVELANARTPLIQARNDFRIAVEELSRILANRPSESIRPSILIHGQLRFHEPKLDLSEAITAARKQRPELERLRLLVSANEQGVQLARADYFPELLAFANYGGESSRFDNDLGDVDHGWKLGLRLNWDIFDGGNTIGRVREARSQKEQADIALQRELLNVDIEVRRAMSRLVEARELVLASRKVVKQAEESLRLARARFDAGSGRQLDVLDTRVSLTEAQTNEVESRHSFNVANAELDRAIGKMAGQ